MFKLGDVDSDLRLVRRRLLSIQKVLTNHLHIWTNGDACILPSEVLLYLPAPIRALILLNRSPEAVTYQGECPPDGQDKVDLIMFYARQLERNADACFEDVVYEWFRDFLVDGSKVTDDTGTWNGLFDTFQIGF